MSDIAGCKRLSEVNIYWSVLLNDTVSLHQAEHLEIAPWAKYESLQTNRNRGSSSFASVARESSLF